MSLSAPESASAVLWQKFLNINWMLVLLLCLLAGIGFAMLYSAAQGSFDPWARQQMTRFALGLILMMMVAVIDIRLWIRHAYTLYGLAVLGLVGVEFFGIASQGAQRWISLGGLRVQPSEVMKIGVILALARYFHLLKQETIVHIKHLIPPIILVLIPFGLILLQPDLGTAGLIVLTSIAMFFAAGVARKYFILLGLGSLIVIPVGWQFLFDYQKQRVLTFLDPERDPLGSGYHVIQSKIALGSGGMFGKGFVDGTQSHLNFLPEKQTDFVFTMFGEEFGFLGGAALILLYMLIMYYGYAIAFRVRNQFGRLVTMGVITTFFLYYLINIAMVSGLFPVVGIPLPMVSYGGTALMSLMVAFGLVMNAWVHRDVSISKSEEL